MSTNVLRELDEEFATKTTNLLNCICDPNTRLMLEELNAILRPNNNSGEYKFDYKNDFMKLFVNKYKEVLSLPLNIGSLNIYKIWIFNLDEKLAVPNVTLRALYSARFDYIMELAKENVGRLNLTYP